MKLIAESPADESDQKRSKLSIASVLSLTETTWSSYTSLSFPDRPSKQSYKTLNQSNLDNVLLIKGWHFQSYAHISLQQQHILSSLNVNSIDWKTNELKSKWWHGISAMSHLASTATSPYTLPMILIWSNLTLKWSRFKHYKYNHIIINILSSNYS